MNKDQNLNIKMIPIDEIKLYEDNPRVNDSAAYKLTTLIRKYGFKVPLLIDKKNVIICGHTRWKAAKILQYKKLPCIIDQTLSPDEVEAFRIADNKSHEFSGWEEELLFKGMKKLADKKYDLELLGFDNKEVDKILEQMKDKIKSMGEILITDELLESHNYLVIYFNNEIDWQTAMDHFNIKTVKTKDSTKSYFRKGIGRVINGSKYLQSLLQKSR